MLVPVLAVLRELLGVLFGGLKGRRRHVESSEDEEPTRSPRRKVRTGAKGLEASLEVPQAQLQVSLVALQEVTRYPCNPPTPGVPLGRPQTTLATLVSNL